MKITARMTKVEIAEEIRRIDRQLAEFEKQAENQNIDPRPWVSRDHPLSVQHWGLVQRRSALKHHTNRATLSPERRKAAAERLNVARKARQDRAGTRVPLSQNATNGSGDPIRSLQPF